MTPVMPFGKFKGCPLDELLDEYLSWLVTSIDLRDPLKTRVQRELACRRIEAVQPANVTLSIDSARTDLALEVVEAGYRAVAKRRHPDAGGSEAEMVELNSLIGHLRKQLAGRQPA